MRTGIWTSGALPCGKKEDHANLHGGTTTHIGVKPKRCTEAEIPIVQDTGKSFEDSIFFLCGLKPTLQPSRNHP